MYISKLLQAVFPRDFRMCAYFILFPAIVIRDGGTIMICLGVNAFKDCTFKVMQNSEMVSVFILNTIAEEIMIYFYALFSQRAKKFSAFSTYHHRGLHRKTARVAELAGCYFILFFFFF